MRLVINFWFLEISGSSLDLWGESFVSWCPNPGASQSIRESWQLCFMISRFAFHVIWIKQNLSLEITEISLQNQVVEAVVQRCSVKKVFLKILQISQENTSARVSFLIKLQESIRKETLAQVFSCEFCEISKNSSVCNVIMRNSVL